MHGRYVVFQQVTALFGAPFQAYPVTCGLVVGVCPHLADKCLRDIKREQLGNGLQLPCAGERLEARDNWDVDAGEAKAEEQLQEYKDQGVKREIQGRQAGIFAGIANNFSSGHMYIKIYRSLDSVFHSKSVIALLFMLWNLFFAVFVWVFLKNMYRGAMRRVLLEARIYPEVPAGHLLHFKLVKCWKRASMTLSLQAIYQALWDITIIGGIIKHYSYMLVPYIVAENPYIKPREAIKLSRRMMDGYKWEACKF